MNICLIDIFASIHTDSLWGSPLVDFDIVMYLEEVVLVALLVLCLAVQLDTSLAGTWVSFPLHLCKAEPFDRLRMSIDTRHKR